MKYQVVLINHGVGAQQAGYSQTFQENISKCLTKYSTINNSEIKTIFKEINWSPITQGVQQALDQRFTQAKGLGQKQIRGIMLNLIGDALAYQESKRGTAIYDQLHSCIHAAIKDVQADVGDENVEYTCIAHSLGSVIASDYCYDHRDEFQLTNFFTLGSPIALWTMRAGMPEQANSPIQIKKPQGVWINIFDDDDAIGWPLKVINQYYNQAVDLDYNTQIGGVISSHTPLSHRGYWEDGNAIKPIAKKLALDQERLLNDTPFDKNSYIQFIKDLWNI